MMRTNIKQSAFCYDLKEEVTAHKKEYLLCSMSIVPAPSLIAPTQSPYFKLETLTVNLKKNSNKEDRFLQTVIFIALESEAARGLIEKYQPAIQASLISELSGWEKEDLISSAGKRRLASALVDAINKVTKEVATKNVYFGSFIIQ